MAADGSQLDNERERSNATSCLCNDHCARGRRRARCMRTKLGQGRRGSEGCRGKSSGGRRRGEGERSDEGSRGQGRRGDEGSRGQGRRGNEGSGGQGRRGDEGSDEQGSRRHEASGRQSQGGREEIAAARVIEGASCARRRGEVVSETPARRGARSSASAAATVPSPARRASAAG